MFRFVNLILAAVFCCLMSPQTAQAQSCGGTNQRACTILERVPSCNSSLAEISGTCRACGSPGEYACPVTVQVPSCDGGLAEVRGRCSSCGGNGELACPVTVRVPSCNSGLAQVGTRCASCGGEGQTPCPLTVRTPSCDAGLIEDFARNQCIVPTNDFDRFRLAAEAEAQAVAPLIIEIQSGFAGGIANSQNVQTLFDLLNSNDHLDFFDRVQQQSRVQALYTLFQRYGFDTLAVSVSWGGSVLGGLHAECGVAVSTQTNAPPIPFIGTFVSGGFQAGGGVDLVVSGYNASPDNISGEAVGIGGSFDVAQGIGLIQWFDPNSGAYLGFSATVGGFGLELGGFAGEGNTYAPYNCGDWE